MGSSAGEVVKVFFLSFVSPDYSRSSVLFNFESTILTKTYIPLRNKSKLILKDLSALKKEISPNAVIVIMSPSHKITFFARCFMKNLVILDAGWPLTDGLLSRGWQKGFVRKLVIAYFLDFVSFHSANNVLVESDAQLARMRKIYLVPKKKLHTSFTGYNECAPSQNPSQSQKIKDLNQYLAKRAMPLTVLFRGKINRESGIETILDSARLLESEASFIIVTSAKNTFKEIPKNCYVVSNVTESEMAYIYLVSDITLGQLSRHPRLKYTIPHKAFESGYFAKSYLTSRSEGIKELFPEGSVYLVDDITVENLAISIKALSSKKLRDELGNAAHARYVKVASQKLLNENFESIILNLYSK